MKRQGPAYKRGDGSCPQPRRGRHRDDRRKKDNAETLSAQRVRRGEDRKLRTLSPHPGGFWQECRRVRKNLKRKDLSPFESAVWQVAGFGVDGPPPPCFL